MVEEDRQKMAEGVVGVVEVCFLKLVVGVEEVEDHHQMKEVVHWTLLTF